MEIKYFEDRNDWRKWLIDNFETANEIWFVFPGKSSGKKNISRITVRKVLHTMTLWKKPFVLSGLTVQ